MTKLAAIFLILPLLGAALIDIYSPEDTGSIDWSGGSVRESQRYIQANLDSWRRDNLSAGLGGISVAIGVVVFAFAVKRDGDDRKAVFGAVGSAVLVLIGAATWMYICVNRFTLPPLGRRAEPEHCFLDDARDGYPFCVRTILLGAVIWQRSSKWAGGVVIAVEIALIAFGTVTFGEIHTWIHCLIFLITGFILWTVGSAGNERSPRLSPMN